MNEMTGALSHQKALAAQEALSQAAASASLRAYLQKMGRDASTAWVRAFGSLDAPATDQVALKKIVAELAARINATPVGGLRALASQALADAMLLGRDHAMETLAEKAVVTKLMFDPALVSEVGALTGRVTSRLDDGAVAMRRISKGASFNEMIGALSKASDSLNVVDRGVAWLNTAGASSGVKQAAKAAGVGRIWVPERDGCLDCTAYAGEVTDTTFPGNLTFGDPKPKAKDLPDPPLHPNCRCSIEPYDLKQVIPPGEISFADALKREAERSVLKGWSVPSEGESVRLRAADRLLKAGTDAPKSVQQSAKRAVKKGAFTGKTAPV